MLTQEELKSVQAVQLELMDEVHRLCEKHHVTYYLIAGSLLGAVRHRGFIPWDLDIDVGMPREDYERFRQLCGAELNAAFIYRDHSTEKMFTRPHALICKRNTTLKLKYDRLNKFNENYGIYMDIFPLDKAPNDIAARLRHGKRLLKIKRFKQYRIPYSYSSSPLKRLAHRIVSAALCWIPVSAINRFQESVMRIYEHDDTDYLCSMASGYSYRKQCMKREIYGSPVLLEFEGRRYCAPARYREYLTQLYGDYMTAPPAEERQKNLEVYQSVSFTDRR